MIAPMTIATIHIHICPLLAPPRCTRPRLARVLVRDNRCNRYTRQRPRCQAWAEDITGVILGQHVGA